MITTHIILIVATVLLVAYDIWAAIGSPPTISQVIWKYLRKHPIIAFVAGLVCGHLFWR